MSKDKQHLETLGMLRQVELERDEALDERDEARQQRDEYRAIVEKMIAIVSEPMPHWSTPPEQVRPSQIVERRAWYSG